MGPSEMALQDTMSTLNTCGDKCRNTPSFRQKRIIEDLMARERKLGNLIGLKSMKN